MKLLALLWVAYSWGRVDGARATRHAVAQGFMEGFVKGARRNPREPS